MTLDAELSFPVKGEHEFSLCSMHTVTGNAGNRLTISWIFHIFSDRMCNFMLLRMALSACLYVISFEIERIIGMRRDMTLKAFSVLDRDTPDGFERLLHEGRPLLSILVAIKAQLRFLNSHILLF